MISNYKHASADKVDYKYNTMDKLTINEFIYTSRLKNKVPYKYKRADELTNMRIDFVTHIMKIFFEFREGTTYSLKRNDTHGNNFDALNAVRNKIINDIYKILPITHSMVKNIDEYIYMVNTTKTK